VSLGLLWDPKAWQDYVDVQSQDKRTLRRINQLIKVCAANPGRRRGRA
jgi:Txe/YoeB family toxin of Txe-Axe toxin-antitoxin module